MNWFFGLSFLDFAWVEFSDSKYGIEHRVHRDYYVVVDLVEAYCGVIGVKNECPPVPPHQSQCREVNFEFKSSDTILIFG